MLIQHLNYQNLVVILCLLKQFSTLIDLGPMQYSFNCNVASKSQLCLCCGKKQLQIKSRISYRLKLESGEQGWRSGESARLPPMWPRFESWRRRHMWVEVVVGSLPCSKRFFSGYSGFPLSLKTNTFKFQFDLERMDTFQGVLMNSLVIRG